MPKKSRKASVVQEVSDSLSNLSGMSGSALPPEIWLLVINLLLNDRGALRALSLTCSALRRLAQPLLFRRVCIKHDPLPKKEPKSSSEPPLEEEFTAYHSRSGTDFPMRKPAGTGLKQAEEKLAFLSSTLVSHAVEECRVDGRTYKYNREGDLEVTLNTVGLGGYFAFRPLLLLFEPLVAHFSNLHTGKFHSVIFQASSVYALSNISWRYLSFSECQYVDPAHAQVPQSLLSVREVVFPSSALILAPHLNGYDLLRAVTACGTLQSLTLAETAEAFHASPDTLPIMQSVTTLGLDISFLDADVGILDRGLISHMHAVQKLAISCAVEPSEFDVSAMSMLLHDTIGAQLVDFSGPYSLASTLTTGCPIHALTLVLDDEDDGEPEDLVNILGPLSNTLRHLTIDYTFLPVDDAHAMGRVLEQITLSAPLLRHLYLKVVERDAIEQWFHGIEIDFKRTANSFTNTPLPEHLESLHVEVDYEFSTKASSAVSQILLGGFEQYKSLTSVMVSGRDKHGDVVMVHVNPAAGLCLG